MRDPRPRSLVLAACLVIAAAVLVIGAGLPQRSDYTRIGTLGAVAVAPEIGAFAPPFPVRTSSGTDMLDYGAPTVINFWATWCAPCEAEMPELQDFQAAHPDAQVIAVNVGDSDAAALNWLAARGITLPVAFDPDSSISSLYAVRGMPTSFVVSPDGIIRHIFFGAVTRSALETQLAAWLT